MGAACSGCGDSSGSEAEPSQRQEQIHNTKMHPAWNEKNSEKVTRQMMKMTTGGHQFSSVSDYDIARNLVLGREAQQAFDWDVHVKADAQEREVVRIVTAIRDFDESAEGVYATQTDSEGYKRLPAGHFLGNVGIINKSELVKIAKFFPKGAHLHCHFNSCLEPSFLIRHARNISTMWIKSTCSLATLEGRQKAEIQFQVQESPQLLSPPQGEGNLLDERYCSGDWMQYSQFREAYGGDEAAEKWLCSKMLLEEEEVYGIRQTVIDIWLRFDVCTRMMKGLFGYESAFRAYTKACIEDFIKDRISYAEIRPNFPSNVLRKDNGRGTIDNRGMMQIIVEEVEYYKKKDKFFQGLRVIYCCPRSFDNEKVKSSLEECISLKREFPDLICGYDLVGSEDRGKPLKTFLNEFLWFQQQCRNLNLNIPFLFHAGETLDTGTDTDLNLLDAVLLNSKRIGHGFALTKHPEVLEMVKRNNICIELCPISNEILHLTPSIKGHAVPDLLARGVHCTVNSDNGTFYSSSLSHDFYQVMIGSETMDVLGWKQLALWSIDHSEMPALEKSNALQSYEVQWREFCTWVTKTYGSQYPEKSMNLA